jgi:hypothetical protein
LTSVLFGEDIPKIDCPVEPVALVPGDIVIVASDGLQFLPDAAIEAILRQYAPDPSAQIADRLLHDVLALDEPDLDNVSFSVIKMQCSDADHCKASGPDTTPGMRRVG